ncbi:hypothetical protein E1B28_000553 [Marasmius oreades]|uniref:Uncharacterized protein n=1 Tax=Marasmius oreades TaxID=181124 RepID=A0A9P8AE93_9AGAR|nr:uncharacterized protein E1B28_000553 [Marasmius oreades]KAG7098636.1 hypothetical protein E1B28_000553 [Marasmius oreades]
MFMFSNAVRRNANEIVLYLSPGQPPPTTVPFELQNQITAGVWDLRISSVIQACSGYSKPWFERIWMVAALIAFIAAPIALQPVVFSAVLRRDSLGPLTAESVVEAKAILFGIFIGTILVFLLPIALWKLMGRTHVNRMTKRWTDADRQQFGQNAAPQWRVKSPGIFRNSIVLSIGLPPDAARPSLFHPNAYLPSYINAPRDADADYYYPYKPEPGFPRMGVVGNVPLYSDEKRELAYQRV